MPDWRALVQERLTGSDLDAATEAEIVEEVAQHLADRYLELRAGGLPEAEARTIALREIEEHERMARDLGRLKRLPMPAPFAGVPGSPWWSGLAEDTRYAVRRLRKRPGASVVSIITLSAGVGAAVATWSLLSAALLRPLAVATPDRLVVVGVRSANGTGTLRNEQLYPLYPAVRDSGVFEGVAGGGDWSLLVGTGGIPEQRTIYFASQNLFDVLGVHLAAGRGFLAADDRRGAPPVAVLSDRLWRREFQADPGVLGRQITVAGQSATVIGVVPGSFRGLNLARPPDLYLPLHTIGDVGPNMINFFAEPNAGSSPTAWVSVIGRLKSGSNTTQATSGLAALAAIPETHGLAFGLTPVNLAAIPEAARAGMGQFSRLLAITVGLLLLISCFTVGMLLLIRTEARQDEFAMCLALGATRGRLARGIAIEGALISLSGATLAMPVAWWLFDGIRSFQLPGGVDIERLELSIDARALAAAAGGAVAATLLIALVAGVFGFSARMADVLRSRSGTPRLTRRRTRALLVGAQVAVTLVLMAGAGLFARSLLAALRLNPGFETSRILTGGVSLAEYGYTPIRATALFDDLRQRLSANPAIQSVSLTVFAGGMGGRLAIDGVPQKFPSTVWFTAIDERYFSTMGMRLLKGRDLSITDTEHAPRVTVVSASFGRLLSDGANPIGRRVTMPFHKTGQPPPVIEIVGVVPDVITNVNALQPLVMYLPLAQQDPTAVRNIVVRANADVDVVRSETISVMKQLDPTVRMTPMLTLDDQLGRQMSPQRFGAVVLGALGGIAALLTLLGAYVLAESMAILRMREMGIRAALGATGRQLGAIVLGETLRLVGLGLAAGLLLAWMGASTIRAFLFHVEPLDPATLAGVAAAILTLALAVSLRPAWRAARVDLGRVLREE
jgi:putative ABC transport system permease protein